jgi:hypothetical protein
MSDPLIELETAARLANEASTLGLSIHIEVRSDGIHVVGVLRRGSGVDAHWMHLLEWEQLHLNPGALSPAVKLVERQLRHARSRTVDVVDLGEGMAP